MTVMNFNKKIPVANVDYDVVVCGGGAAGFAAALAAARQGVKTALIEGQGQLGGMATSGLVSHWLGGRDSDCQTWVIGGIFRELSKQMERNGYARIPSLPAGDALSPHGWDRGQLAAGVPLNPYYLSYLLDSVLAEAGVDVLLLTNFVDAVVESHRIRTVIVHNKSGLQAISGKMFIDATGDADLAARSGCPVQLGREGDNLCGPSTLMMHVDGMDTTAISAAIRQRNDGRFLQDIKIWSEDGTWPFAYNRFISVQLDRDDVYMINTSRVCGVDGTNGRSISAGMQKGRAENMQILQIMREQIPGCGNAQLRSFGTLMGIRETRRILGNFVLRVSDLYERREFPDTIAYSSYCWDMPDPVRPSYQPMHEKPNVVQLTRTPIPFRVMLPQTITNLLCPGRAISAEREVLGPLRVQAPCIAMGEAAGIAAALSLREMDFSRTDMNALQDTLTKSGALLHP